MIRYIPECIFGIKSTVNVKLFFLLDASMAALSEPLRFG